MKTYNIKRAFKNLTCHRCREEINVAEKYFLDLDSKKWSCQQCNREGQIFGGIAGVKDFAAVKDFCEDNADQIVTITVFLTRDQQIDKKVFGLYKNSVFKEIKA